MKIWADTTCHCTYYMTAICQEMYYLHDWEKDFHQTTFLFFYWGGCKCVDFVTLCLSSKLPSFSSMFTFLFWLQWERGGEGERKTGKVPCTENLGQIPRNLGDRKRQIIRHKLSISVVGKSASGESRVVPEDEFLLGEHRCTSSEL